MKSVVDSQEHFFLKNLASSTVVDVSICRFYEREAVCSCMCLCSFVF